MISNGIGSHVWLHRTAPTSYMRHLNLGLVAVHGNLQLVQLFRWMIVLPGRYLIRPKPNTKSTAFGCTAGKDAAIVANAHNSSQDASLLAAAGRQSLKKTAGALVKPLEKVAAMWV